MVIVSTVQSVQMLLLYYIIIVENNYYSTSRMCIDSIEYIMKQVIRAGSLKRDAYISDLAAVALFENKKKRATV